MIPSTVTIFSPSPPTSDLSLDENEIRDDDGVVPLFPQFFTASKESSEGDISLEVDDADGEQNDIQTRKKRKYCKLRHSQMVHINNVSSNPYKIRLPKVPSTDIRRKYPLMLLNTLNSMDVALMHSFFHTFTHPESVLRRQVVSHENPDKELERLSFYGCDQIFAYVFVLSLLSPDRVMMLKRDATIITRSNSYRTEIVLEGYSYTSWPYDTDPVKAGHYLLSILNRASAELKRTQPGADPELSGLERMFQQHHLRLAKCPKRVRIHGKITMVISNIYERQEIDELVATTYGLYESSEPKTIE